MRPSWLGTNLGQALITAAEALHAEPDQEARRFQSQIVLVTDLQQGSERDGLRSYAWPSDIAIDVRQVTSERITNARAEVLPPDAGYSPADRAAVRVRVLNAGDSTRSTFGLRWATADNQRLFASLDRHWQSIGKAAKQ